MLSKPMLTDWTNLGDKLFELINTNLSQKPKLSPESQKLLNEDRVGWICSRSRILKSAFRTQNLETIKKVFYEYVAIRGIDVAKLTISMAFDREVARELNGRKK